MIKQKNIKYILEVFGAKAEKITSMIGSAKFKECKSSTNCYITTDENFFGPNQLDKFDAVVFKPGHLRADKVLFFNPSPHFKPMIFIIF